MARRKASNPTCDPVGYRKPPKSTRFKKGSSGNPKGRPKGSRGVSAVLRDVMRQRVEVTENGQVKHLPGLEVMLRRAFNDAMRSGPAAQKFFFSLIDRYGDLSEEVTVPNAEEALAEDVEILRRYLDTKNPGQVV